ncbi:MAG: amidohydrolase family protein [Candidatus Izemoplasmatales bacterium]|nr:amidohydrolase family protein [Candidatus Izemoplasmatales bacterium]
MDKAIINGDVYIDGSFHQTNLYIHEGKIALLSQKAYPADEIIDARHLMVFPGLIDPHVHFDLDLGTFRSVDDFAYGSQLAALGGVTTIIDFLEPVTNEQDLMKAWMKRKFEAEDCHIDYRFHATIMHPETDLERFVQKMLSLGIVTLKCFTTYKESGRMTQMAQIVELLELSRKYRFLLLVHAEDDAHISLDPGMTYRDLPRSRPTLAETSMADQLARIVRQTGGYLYMVHVSSGDTIELLKRNYPDLLNAHFFIESCPQYFLFNDSVFSEEEGYLYTCAPPIRSERERSLLQNNIDFVHTIGTDHCAFPASEKDRMALHEMPLGLGSIEHSFDMMYHRFGLKVIDKMTENIATLNHISGRKGKIKVGYDADVFLYDRVQGTVSDDHSLANYSVYLGQPKSGSVISTLCRGEFVIRDRMTMHHQGQYLEVSR